MRYPEKCISFEKGEPSECKAETGRNACFAEGAGSVPEKIRRNPHVEEQKELADSVCSCMPSCVTAAFDAMFCLWRNHLAVHPDRQG